MSHSCTHLEYLWEYRWAPRTWLSCAGIWEADTRAGGSRVAGRRSSTLCHVVQYKCFNLNVVKTGLPSELSGWRICLQCRRPRFDSWVGKIPWRRKWQSTPVFLTGKSNGQRSLEGYSPRHHKEPDTAEQLTLSLFHPSGQKQEQYAVWWCWLYSLLMKILYF